MSFGPNCPNFKDPLVKAEWDLCEAKREIRELKAKVDEEHESFRQYRIARKNYYELLLAERARGFKLVNALEKAREFIASVGYTKGVNDIILALAEYEKK